MSERDISKSAILHITDSAYCFPVSDKEIVLRIRTAKNDILRAEVIYESKYSFGMTQKRVEMKKAFSDYKYDFFTVKLLLDDTRLAYVFYITDRDGSYYFSEDGVSLDYNFQLGYYNFFQYPYINLADIHRNVKWMQNAVFYQIFVERFCIGNKEKDMSYVNLKWGDIPNAKSFAGGDLKGITEKLNYIKELGINTIYLTPVFESISNHKYDIKDYKKVDPSFGGNEDLYELIEEAHKREIKIVLDAVFNHCSDEISEFQDVKKRGVKSPFHDWFLIQGDKPDETTMNYETFASCCYMPKWNTSNKEVQKYLIDIALFWMQNYHIDGWRLDVSDEVSHDFWRNFRKEIKAVNQDIIIIGENWHDASNYLRGDQYDSIMNYAFTKACLDFFAFNQFTAQDLADKLSCILMRNTDTVNSMMLNLLDCHDTNRFINEVGGNINKLKAAISIMMLFPGAPCIYYGTEIALQGGYDPDNRRCMDWQLAEEAATNGDIYSLIQFMSEVRKTYEVNEMETSIYSRNDIFVLERFSNNHKLRLYVNNQNVSKTVDNIVIGPYETSLIIDDVVRKDGKHVKTI